MANKKKKVFDEAAFQKELEQLMDNIENFILKKMPLALRGTIAKNVSAQSTIFVVYNSFEGVGILEVAKKEYAEEWAVCQQLLMEKAAKVIIPSGLLKAEASISEFWTK